jgi:methylmalonyl-CoA mutase, C-terminal domain
MAKFGEGFESAVMKLARAFSEAGFEVIYTELQDPAAIVASAIQESVDHIGITTLPGADINRFQSIFQLLEREQVSHIRVTAGGYLEESDIPTLKDLGVVEFFPKGTTYDELIEWASRHIKPVEL